MKRPPSIFAHRLRTSRERILMSNGGRLTQGALAKLVGVKRNTVSRWENSEIRPKSPAAVRRLADVLKVPIEYLFPRDGEVEMAGADESGESVAIDGVPVIRDGPPRHPYWTNDALMRLVPPRAYTVIHGHVTRVAESKASQVQVEETLTVLLRAASTPLRSRSATERTIEEMIADVESAWEYVAAVLRRDGRSV